MILGRVTDSVGPILPAGADGDCGEEFSPALRVHLCPVCREVSPTNCPQSDASKVHRHKGSKQHWRWGALGACTGGGERWVPALEVGSVGCLHWRWGALGACTGGGERWVPALEVGSVGCLH